VESKEKEKAQCSISFKINKTISILSNEHNLFLKIKISIIEILDRFVQLDFICKPK
jgi:hypothetical protein